MEKSTDFAGKKSKFAEQSANFAGEKSKFVMVTGLSGVQFGL